MKWIASVWLVLFGCGDATGTSGECAFGGALTDCPDAERTVEAACWRLVECGRIVVDDEVDMNAIDWGECVDGISAETDDRVRVIVNCVAAATCDELRVDDFCFVFGQE